jgi:cell wall-associated NlpC family hydrolase
MSTTTIRERIVALAAAEVGYAETPANSNKTKYGKWFGLDGVAWCGMFVSWVFDKAGAPLGRIGFLRGFAGCQTAVAHFRKRGELVTDPLPGDIVFFDWNGDGRHDHTGIYVKRLTATTFETIEGNTSLTNQSNGGTVMRRTRSMKNVLFARPKSITT